ncbi:265_t:CDS:1 [Paraglomus occultum]|uniref:265_t:CDS:1 n=1 Tax=Paraglomus occultum TaxID=144539 RepID=A0A9N8ZV13_9GLOM|nr:265_t:CDS:1 [Paraglomus occultum]
MYQEHYWDLDSFLYNHLSLSNHLVNSAEYSNENFQLLTRPPYKTYLPPIDLVHPGTRLSKSRSRRDDQPPRPQNGFIIFKKDFDARRRSILSDTKVDSKVMSKTAAYIWHSDEGLRKYFNLLAKLAAQIHKELYPEYDYKPKKCSTETEKGAKPLRIRQYSGPSERRAKRREKVVGRREAEDFCKGFDASGQAFSGQSFMKDVVVSALNGSEQ